MNTERDNWRDITPEDATDAELHLVYRIMGPRPHYVSPEQWRENMQAVARDIRAHVASCQRPPLVYSSDVVVNGFVVAVRWNSQETYADLVQRAFKQTNTVPDPTWELRDGEGYEIHLSERLEPCEMRTRKNLYLNPRVGVGA